MSNNLEYPFLMEDGSDLPLGGGHGDHTVVISNETTTSGSDVSLSEMSDLIIQTRPGFKDIIEDWIPLHPEAGTSDLLDYLESLETDGNDDPESVTVTNSHVSNLFLDELKDIAFEASGDIRVTIHMNGDVVLDNLYTPGFDGMVHLDLQDLVRQNTTNYLPTLCTIDDLVLEGITMQIFAHSLLYTRITDASGNNDDYYFTVYGFESGAQERCTDIDFLRIPKDYLLPLSMFMSLDDQRYGSLSTYMESGQRRQLLISRTKPFQAGADYTPGDAFLFSRDIHVAAVPARPGEHFRLVIISDGTRAETNHLEEATFHREIATPVMKLCPGEFHQYIFLNKYGHYDNIPMSGAKTYAPEYEIENADRTYSIEKVRSSKREAFTQNTGPQTSATLEALAELLLSPKIFHYIPGKSLRRIVVENPTLTINSKNSINTATFSWRYAGK